MIQFFSELFTQIFKDDYLQNQNKKIMEIYLFALAGIAVYILLDLTNLQKSTPNLTLLETVKSYFNINMFYITAGVLVTMVVISLAGEDSGLLKSIGIDFEQGKGSAFFIGLTFQVILSNIRKFINPVAVETKNDTVVMTKDK